MTDEAGRSGDSRDGLRPDDEWLRSKAYEKAAKDRRLSLIVGGVGLVAGILTWAVPSLRKEAPGLMTAGPVWFGVAVSVTFFRYYTAQRRWQERQEFATRDSGSAAPGFAGELDRSRDEMDRSRLMYRNQAGNSNRNSQAAMILGLIFITGFAAAAVFVAKASSSRFVFVGVGAVGAAYSAYISKTFIAQRESSQERYDSVLSRIEHEYNFEYKFSLAERMIHDTSGLSKPERLTLTTKLLEVRLLAIEKFMEKPDKAGDWSSAPAYRRRGLARRGWRADDRRADPVDQPPMDTSPASLDPQKVLQALFLDLGSRLQLDPGAGTSSNGEAGEEGPSVN